MIFELTGNKKGHAIIDGDDYDGLSKYSWNINKRGYIHGTVNGKTISMHKFLMKCQDNTLIDHINRIKHDNRKKNLRIITELGNEQNKSKTKSVTSSKYKGVCYEKKTNKYRTYIIVNRKRIHLGKYKTEKEAA